MSQAAVHGNLSGASSPFGSADGGASAAARRWRLRMLDSGLLTLVRGSGLIVILMLVSLFAVLGYAAVPSIRTFGAKFITSSEWRANELERPARDTLGKVI